MRNVTFSRGCAEEGSVLQRKRQCEQGFLKEMTGYSVQCLPKKAEGRLPAPGLDWPSRTPPPHPRRASVLLHWGCQACCQGSQVSFRAALPPSPICNPLYPASRPVLGQAGEEIGRSWRKADWVILWSCKPGLSHAISSPPSSTPPPRHLGNLLWRGDFVAKICLLPKAWPDRG